ncbi:hypothetical protein KI387_022959 [Taxus chinensis]|uniref:CASP-like protein n=1 Tax=Taxus chinensis TaxID=29808 RepID=A0AA38LB75_TAXCH|nr:hypothetical protein KI387_022959 [Taxus chinensis]
MPWNEGHKAVAKCEMPPKSRKPQCTVAKVADKVDRKRPRDEEKKSKDVDTKPCHIEGRGIKKAWNGNVPHYNKSFEVLNPFLNCVGDRFRTVPLILCIASMAVMLQNNQTNEYGPLRYANVAAFKYLVYANGICAGYSLFSAIDSALFAGLYSLSRAWVIFILDQVLAYVLLSAVAAGTEILFLGYKGDRKVSWSEVCGAYEKFCYRGRASIVISSVGVVCFVGLSLASAYRLFVKYDPPVAKNDRGNSSSEG